jgi:hypothetical protein
LGVTGRREVAELKARLKRANAAIARQKEYIQNAKAGLAKVRACLLKAIRNLEPK